MTCTVFGFFIGILLFSTMALLPPMMQQLMGYPALTSGLVSMPRGIGSFVAMFAVGRLIGQGGHPADPVHRPFAEHTSPCGR